MESVFGIMITHKNIIHKTSTFSFFLSTSNLSIYYLKYATGKNYENSVGKTAVFLAVPSDLICCTLGVITPYQLKRLLNLHFFHICTIITVTVCITIYYISSINEKLQLTIKKVDTTIFIIA